MTLAISLGILVISFIMLGGFTFFTVRHRSRGESMPLVNIEGQPVPRVSILIPSRNSDADLDNIIESIFLVDYPDFEIVYAMDTMNGPVVDTIKKFQAQYPHVTCKIMATGHSQSENPKVYKLAKMEDEASGDLYWVLDTNIRVKRDTLNRLVNEYLQNGAKLIFSPIHGEGGKTLGGIIESSYFNHFLSGNVIMAWKLFRLPIVVGKSLLIERKALDRFGGFTYFKDYLAEDYVMGETFTQSKIPISTNCTWVTSVSHGATLRSFFSRMARWAKLRYRLAFHFYLLEIVLNPITLAAASALTLGSKTGLLVLAASIGLKIMLEFISYLFLDSQGRRSLKVILLLPLAILIKDMLLLAVYFTPFFSCQVEWRGGKISIGKRTLISFSQESLLFDGV